MPSTILDFACGHCFVALVLTLGACSHSQSTAPQKKPEYQPSPPEFSITRIDGGQLTRYAPGVKGLTTPVAGTSLHRTFIILNDPASPIEIVSFGFHTSDELLSSRPCMPEKPESWSCAKLTYVLQWSLKARSAVTAWEVHNLVFDAMNRFLWDDKIVNNTRGDDASIEAGAEHKTDRVAWWNSSETGKLSEWVTSLLVVGAVRTKENIIWNCNRSGLQSQMKSLSLEIPPLLRSGPNAP